MVLHSPVMVLHSLVLVFTQSSFNFYTVQFYFFTQSSFIFTQSSFIFCVVTRPLSRYCNTCYLTAAILYFLATMDSIILWAVREELRRSSSTLTLLRQKSLIFLPCLRQNSNFHTLFKTFVEHTRRLFIVHEKIPCLRQKWIKSMPWLRQKMIKSIPCLRQKSRKNTPAGRTSLLSPYKGLVPPPRVLGSSF